MDPSAPSKPGNVFAWRCLWPLTALFCAVTCRASDGPERLRATPLSDTSIRLDWAGEGAGLVVERSTDERHYTQVGAPGTGSAAFIDTGLTPGQLYFYRVRSGASTAAWCRWVFATTLQNVSSTAATRFLTASWTWTGTVKLLWKDEFSNESGFAVERAADGGAFAPLATVAGSVTTFEDTATQAGSRYSYRVRVLGPGGPGAWSDSVKANLYRSGPETYTQALIPPGGVAAQPVFTCRNDVTWNDLSAGESGFAVLYSFDGIRFRLAGTTGPDVTLFHHDGIFDGLDYHYAVVALGADHSASLPSAPAAVQALGFDEALAPPSRLTVVETQTGVDLSWEDHSGNESGFAVERDVGGTGQQYLHFQRIAVLGPHATQYHDPDGNLNRYYRVQALGASGASRYSATWSGNGWPVPVPASGLSATALSPIKIRLTWFGDSNSTYYVERSLDGTTFRRVALVVGTSHDDTDLQPDTSYTYRIAISDTEHSASAAATTPPVSSPPPAPSGLAAVGVSRSQINLRWNVPAPNSSSLTVERSDDGGAQYATVAVLNGRASCYSDLNVSPSLTYSYRLWAANAAGASPYSAAKSASTAASDPAPSFAVSDHGAYRRLTIRGTDANDQLSVSQSGADLVVSANGAPAQSFTGPFGELILHGLGGEDLLRANASVTVRTLLYGGQGDDILEALGAGKNTLVAVGGGRDRCQGNGVHTSYWVDEEDLDEAQPSAQERNAGCLHRVATFQGALGENRSKELDGQSWKDPWIYGFGGLTRYPTHSFWGRGPLFADVNQGNFQDCGYTSFWQAAGGMVPDVLEEWGVDLGDGTYAVKYGPPNGDFYARVDGDVNPPTVSVLGPSASQWWLIMEKCYYGYFLPQPSNGAYPKLNPHQGAEAFYAEVVSALQARHIVWCGTLGEAYLDAPTVLQGHWYAILGAFRELDGTPRFILRDPYGYSDTSFHRNVDEQKGLITLTFDELRTNFLAPQWCDLHFPESGGSENLAPELVSGPTAMPNPVFLAP